MMCLLVVHLPHRDIGVAESKGLSWLCSYVSSLRHMPASPLHDVAKNFRLTQFVPPVM